MERAYPDRPILAVGIVVQRRGEVLIVQRAKEPSRGVWSIPGGMVELGETIEEAAHREVREECSIEIRVDGVVFVVDAIREDDEGETLFHYALIEMAAVYLSGRLAAASDAMDARWVQPSELGDYRVPSVTREVIERAIRGGGRAGLAHFPPAI